MSPLLAVDLTYTWSQALADLSQIAAIATLTGFFLFAIVVDLVLPKSRRGGAVAMTAVTGFAFALGTAAYLAPEQAVNSKETDGRADVYSLGCSLYYLLTACYVHDPAPTPAEMFRRILQDEPVPIRMRREDVPPELATAIHRAMERTPRSRFPCICVMQETMSAFA